MVDRLICRPGPFMSQRQWSGRQAPIKLNLVRSYYKIGLVFWIGMVI